LVVKIEVLGRAFAQTAAELETRIRFLLHRINDQPTNQEVTRT
jgi:hypothetical protein